MKIWLYNASISHNCFLITIHVHVHRHTCTVLLFMWKGPTCMYRAWNAANMLLPRIAANWPMDPYNNALYYMLNMVLNTAFIILMLTLKCNHLCLHLGNCYSYSSTNQSTHTHIQVLSLSGYSLLILVKFLVLVLEYCIPVLAPALFLSTMSWRSALFEATVFASVVTVTARLRAHKIS